MEHPGEEIKRLMLKHGWNQLDLAAITGKPVADISRLSNAKVGITARTAKILAAVFSETNPFYWMQIQNSYLLYKHPVPEFRLAEIRKRAAHMSQHKSIKTRPTYKKLEERVHDLEGILKSLRNKS